MPETMPAARLRAIRLHAAHLHAIGDPASTNRSGGVTNLSIAPELEGAA
jgi:hypothetical protein